MKLKLRFFASMKELMGCEVLDLDAQFAPATVAGLRNYLSSSNESFAKAVAGAGRVRAAVNQDMADDDTVLSENAEVAFFPPVTGG